MGFPSQNGGGFSPLRSLLPLKFQVLRSSDSTLEIPTLPRPPALSPPHLTRFSLRSHAELFPTGVDCPHESPHFLASEILQPPKSYNHQGTGALLPGSRIEPLTVFYCVFSSLEFQASLVRVYARQAYVVFDLGFDQHGLLGTFYMPGGGGEGRVTKGTSHRPCPWGTCLLGGKTSHRLIASELAESRETAGFRPLEQDDARHHVVSVWKPGDLGDPSCQEWEVVLTQHVRCGCRVEPRTTSRDPGCTHQDTSSTGTQVFLWSTLVCSPG